MVTRAMIATNEKVKFDLRKHRWSKVCPLWSCVMKHASIRARFVDTPLWLLQSVEIAVHKVYCSGVTIVGFTL